MVIAAKGLRFRLWPCLACLLALSALGQILQTPCLTLSAGERRLAIYEARPGLTLTIDFIHSVQKTPVREMLAVEEGGASLGLVETRYRSFGVGLPFLESEGDFRQEGDEFVLRGMGRHFSELALRTGVGTQLTLTVSGAGREQRIFRLYEEFPPGTRIDVRLQPLYEIIFTGLQQIAPNSMSAPWGREVRDASGIPGPGDRLRWWGGSNYRLRA